MDLELTLDPGGGAFYGPKISVQARDAIGRTWQVSTVQVDFQLPQRFEMEYVGQDNERHRPIMIHRALFGSVERFFAILLEHYAGAFPTWLAPVQVRVLPVRDDHGAYARQVRDRLIAAKVRAEADEANEPLGARIRRAKLEEASLYPRRRGHGRGRRDSRGERAWLRGARTWRQRRVVRATPAGRGCCTHRRRRFGGDMSLDHLWAGWRSNYVNSFADGAPATGAIGSGEEPRCVFCEIMASDEPDDVRRVLWTGKFTVALLNAYPYCPGHIMVLPIRHIRDLPELEPEESAELSSAVREAVAAVRAAYKPEGLNLGLNLGRAAGAGIPADLHVHIVPRWIGDTNFMTSVAGVRVLPEALDDSWAKLRAAWT